MSHVLRSSGTSRMARRNARSSAVNAGCDMMSRALAAHERALPELPPGTPRFGLGFGHHHQSHRADDPWIVPLAFQVVGEALNSYRHPNPPPPTSLLSPPPH